MGEKVDALLPKDRIRIQIELSEENHRIVRVYSFGKLSALIVRAMDADDFCDSN